VTLFQQAQAARGMNMSLELSVLPRQQVLFMVVCFIRKDRHRPITYLRRRRYGFAETPSTFLLLQIEPLRQQF